MKRTLLICGILVVASGIIWLSSHLWHLQEEVATTEERGCTDPCDLVEQTPLALPEKKTLHVTASQWGYDLESVEIIEGDTVEVILTSADVPHSFSMGDFGEFGINEVALSDRETRFEFVADKAGDFIIACDIFCGRGHSEMLATLSVRKRPANTK